MGQITRRLAGAVILCAVLGSSPVWAGSITRTSSFAYDATSGQLTQEVIEPDTPALRLQTDYGFDAFGNRISVTVSGADIVSRGSTSAYDVRGQFVSSNTNALGQSESLQFDARFATPTSQTGPNGLTTTWSYDSLGRKILEVRPDGTRTKMAYLFCSGVNGGTTNCISGASYVIQATPLAADGITQNGPVGVVYYDLLDREIARESQGFDGSTVRAATQYNALGQVAKTSRPYFAVNGTPQWTTLSYDALSRVVTTVAPDGSTTQAAYHGLVVSQTNAMNQTQTVTTNSVGQVVSVTDPLGRTMTYGYDAIGNMLQTTDAVGNVVTAAYDTRGRNIASSDPDLGYRTYSYNALGELITQIDAKGQTTSVTYDKLGRLVQRIEPDMTSVWVYDSVAHGIGKLVSSGITAGPGAGFQRTVSYDALGRPVQVATTIDGATYVIGASYDASGRPSKVSYPSGFIARYGYNTLGYANQLLDDATSQVHWTANAMDADGNLTQQTVGNGLVTTRSFNAATGRLNSITTGSGNAVQNLSYTYDPLGNPLSRSDANTNLSETFTYDGLNRLTSATVNLTPTPLSKTFTYDVIGNLLSKSDVGNYSYAPPGSPRPHAVTGVSGGAISATFTYDPNGNQTSGLGRNITWTSYNKPASITQGARTFSFVDDVDHQRIKQVTPEGTTLYISAFGVLAELTSPGTSSERWTEYLSVGSAKVGMRTIQTASETVTSRYFHTDHLGSISVITNENGVVVERPSYDAWGKRRFPNGADDVAGSITSQSTRGFTGEEQLSTGGLVHLNGRVYDPVLARFTSADSIVPNATYGQNWNRYAYVLNNPLKYTDPTGHHCDGPDPIHCSVELDPLEVFASPGSSGAGAPGITYGGGSPSAGTGGGSSGPSTPPATPSQPVVQAPRSIPAVTVTAPPPRNSPGRFVPGSSGSGPAINPGNVSEAVNTDAYDYLGAFSNYVSNSLEALARGGRTLREDLSRWPLDTAERIANSFPATKVEGEILKGGATILGVIGPYVRLGPRIVQGVDASTLVRSHSIGGSSSIKSVDRIASSMRVDGYAGDAIKVIESDGRMIIVDGHHRAAAARMTGTPVNVEILGPEAFPMGPGGWQSIDEVISASQTAGPNSLYRPRRR